MSFFSDEGLFDFDGLVTTEAVMMALKTVFVESMEKTMCTNFCLALLSQLTSNGIALAADYCDRNAQHYFSLANEIKRN